MISLCERCSEDIGEYAYTVEGETVCEDCFKEYVESLLITDIASVAEALGVDREYLG